MAWFYAADGSETLFTAEWLRPALLTVDEFTVHDVSPCSMPYSIWLKLRKLESEKFTHRQSYWDLLFRSPQRKSWKVVTCCTSS